MDDLPLFVGLFSGAFGFAYLMYGKKRERKVMMASGIVLLVYPYLISNHALLLLIAAVFILLPILVRH
jgi:hypothetical protein